MAYYETRSENRPMACDECGSMVDSSERGRTLHAAWHAERAEIVVDVRDLKLAVA